MRDITPQYQVNPSQRTPCMLVLDASGSMETPVKRTGKRRIDELNEGLIVLQQELLADVTASQRVQLAIVCVGGPAGDADVLMDWTDALDFRPPKLIPGGLTPLGKGMRLALNHISQHKETLKSNGIGFTRPWLMVISDGVPSDETSEWQAAIQECRAAEAAKRCIIYPIGVGDAELPVLQHLSSTPALQLAEARFRELFQWLSGSLQSLSRSRPGDAVQLAAVNPWAVVS